MSLDDLMTCMETLEGPDGNIPHLVDGDHDGGNVTCAFCPDGLTNSTLVPFPSDDDAGGPTCEQIKERTEMLPADHAECPTMQRAEAHCCPGTTTPSPHYSKSHKAAKCKSGKSGYHVVHGKAGKGNKSSKGGRGWDRSRPTGGWGPARRWG